MKFSGSLPSRLVLIAAGAFSLAACGQAPGSVPAEGSAPRKTALASSSEIRLERLRMEERALLADPLCGAADDAYIAAILNVVERFNEFAREENGGRAMKLLYAGHPDSPDGVPALVCASGRVSAAAYTRTVALGDGLLRALREASEASAIFGGDSAALSSRLGRIAYLARDGVFGGSLPEDERRLVESDPATAARADELFTSALAFVLFHELAHTQPGEAASDLSDPYLELKADMFATKAMIASGFTMEGAELVFSVLDRMTPEGSMEHPAPFERARTVRGFESAMETSAMDSVSAP